MRKQGHSALRVKNGKIETFDPHPSTASQSNATPLTYGQEVHALLCAAAANTESLLSYFETQANTESGDAKKLTQKCIDWKREDLRRIRALIPRALERRDDPTKELFEEHTKHVQQFLNDLWAFSIGPLHEGMQGMKVAEVCAALLKAAKDNRDSVYELEGLFRTACQWVWKGLDAPGQTLESTMEAMRTEYTSEQLKQKELGT